MAPWFSAALLSHLHGKGVAMLATASTANDGHNGIKGAVQQGHFFPRQGGQPTFRRPSKVQSAQAVKYPHGPQCPIQWAPTMPHSSPWPVESWAGGQQARLCKGCGALQHCMRWVWWSCQPGMEGRDWGWGAAEEWGAVQAPAWGPLSVVIKDICPGLLSTVEEGPLPTSGVLMPPPLGWQQAWDTQLSKHSLHNTQHHNARMQHTTLCLQGSSHGWEGPNLT